MPPVLAEPDARARDCFHMPVDREHHAIAPREARNNASFTAALLTFARRVLVGMAGGLVLLVGLAMTVLPGPAIVVVPLGLAILATEFLWAKRLCDKLRQSTDRVRSGWAARKNQAAQKNFRRS
jgi:uncharacterized protein (TIGR02611 family)